MVDAPNVLLEAALDYARRGWRVLPLYAPDQAGVCDCYRVVDGHPPEDPRHPIGKHPCTKHGLTDATSDEVAVRNWWGKMFQRANIAVATGAGSGFVALDVDPRHGGGQSLEKLEQLHGRIPATVEAWTGGGGRHLLFAHPGRPIPNKVMLAPGLDIRGDGGYIVVAPSLHASGKRYQWHPDNRPDQWPLSTLPEWLLAIIETPTQSAASTGPAAGEPIIEGQRNQTLARMAGAMRRHGMGEEAICTALMAENAARCRPPLEESEVRKIAHSVARYAPASERQSANGQRQGTNAPAKDTGKQGDGETGRGADGETGRRGEGAQPAAPSPQAGPDLKGLVARLSNNLLVKEVYVAAAELAALPFGDYATVKAELKKVYGKALNSNDLDHAVSEAREKLRKSRTRQASGLPEILVSDRPLRDCSADALSALLQANTPPQLFVRSGSLARARADENGRPIIDTVGETELRGRVARVCDTMRRTENGLTHVAPPVEIVRDLLALGSWPFPPLEAVVETPVLRPGGTILDAPGYDPATRLIYAPAAGLQVPPVPMEPSRDQVREAISLVWEAVGEFPYVDEASKANLLALMLTPVLRPVFQGRVPLALIDAPKAGTGKSLLADMVALVATGRQAAMMTAPSDDEEWRKKLTSALVGGATVVVIDNVEGRLVSPSLASVLTSPTWQDRILGRSELVNLPQRATWIATGNNIRLGGDLPRRCYPIRLDPQNAEPWLRTGFTHPDLPTWVEGNRGRLLAALLTIARAWFAAGQPVTSGEIMGSFEGWARTLGNVLAVAGVPGFLANLREMYQLADDDATSWETFLANWCEVLGERDVTVAELIEVLQQHPDFRAALPDQVGDLPTDGNFQKIRRKLGNSLSRRKDAFFGRYRIERAGTDSHTEVVRWRVKVAGSAGSAGSHSGGPYAQPSTPYESHVGGGSNSSRLKQTRQDPADPASQQGLIFDDEMEEGEL